MFDLWSQRSPPHRVAKNRPVSANPLRFKIRVAADSGRTPQSPVRIRKPPQNRRFWAFPGVFWAPLHQINPARPRERPWRTPTATARSRTRPNSRRNCRHRPKSAKIRPKSAFLSFFRYTTRWAALRPQIEHTQVPHCFRSKRGVFRKTPCVLCDILAPVNRESTRLRGWHFQTANSYPKFFAICSVD